MLLEIKNLKTYFYGDKEPVKAVDGVSLAIGEGEILALVGESGSGKSVTALSVTRLLPRRNCSIESGEILFNGRDILKLNEEELRGIRGKEVAYVFQEPATSLNPLFTVGFQLTEAITAHRRVSKRAASREAVESLEAVGISSAEDVVEFYPHQLSGGMKQRAMIAMAVSMRPKLLIADEPTTSLDVTIEAQILDLLSDIRERFGMSVLLITHDLRVARHTADRVAVMRSGRIVEEGAVDKVFNSPSHSYTRMLIDCIPGSKERH
ncbi:MAG: hypothetical protein AUJ75_01900 [Candidatus Omnitrophica bacterium CG1_02_49_10]|nr:MAG: hypothetical protein AUJ75_01900 [Candidatus Omnitrophica bacterium CG1_02_49_10]